MSHMRSARGQPGSDRPPKVTDVAHTPHEREGLNAAAAAHQQHLNERRKSQAAAPPATCPVTVDAIVKEAHDGALPAPGVPVHDDEWQRMLDGSTDACVCPVCRAHTVDVCQNRVSCEGCGFALRLSDTVVTAEVLARKIAGAVYSHEASGCVQQPSFSASTHASYLNAPRTTSRVATALAALLDEQGPFTHTPDEQAQLAKMATFDFAPRALVSDDTESFLTLSCSLCGAVSVVV
eukprot:Rhum_TRINITY_DN13710_c0_g3::Rhum_TRINITY_DN13710_c0_g3_i3::g.63329::m.63329